MARPKDMPEARARHERQAVEGAQAIAEYRRAEGAALDRMARLRSEREAQKSAASLEAQKRSAETSGAQASQPSRE
jgi:hypothetical protein